MIANIEDQKQQQQKQEQDNLNLMSFHQANIWFNECYADYLTRQQAQAAPGAGVKRPVMKLAAAQDSSTNNTNTNSIDHCEFMRMLCSLMKENAELRQKKNTSTFSSNEDKDVNANLDVPKDRACVVVKPNETHSKASLTFENKLIIQGKVLGSVHCRRSKTSQAQAADSSVASAIMEVERPEGGYSISDNGKVSSSLSSSASVSALISDSKSKSYRGCVIVEEGGVLNSNLRRIHEVIVMGRVIGKIDCEVLCVGSSAQIVGNIRVASLSVAQGATIVGKITTGRAFPHSKHHSSDMSTASVTNHSQLQEPIESDNETMKEYIESINKLMEKPEFTSYDFEEVQRIYYKMSQ